MFPRSCGPDGCDILHLQLGPVECAKVLIVDVAGQVVFDESLCKPDKCIAPEGGVLGFDTCGGEGFGYLSWAEWQEIPDGCGEQPDTSGISCQLPPAPATSTTVPALLYLLACLLRRRTGHQTGYHRR